MGFKDLFRKAPAPALTDRSQVDGLRYADLQVCAQMVKHGFDLKAPVHSLFYLYFPSSEGAAAAAAELSARGLSVRVREPEGVAGGAQAGGAAGGAQAGGAAGGAQVGGAAGGAQVGGAAGGGVRNDWAVIAESRTNALIPDFLRETVDACEATAAAHGGEYDGWEAGPA